MSRKWLWTALACLLAGAVILLYYPMQGMIGSVTQQKAVSGFRKEIARLQASGQSQDIGEGGTLLPELYDSLREYNEKIYENGQSGLKDAWSYEQSSFDLEGHGFPGGVYGILKIPAMDAELPLYLGASEKNMAKGAAVLGETSVPIGQPDSNSVIAAHRGYSGTAMFREIERLSAGDEVEIQNPWGILRYRVSETKIIEPDDVEAIRIQQGKEMVTLITCHPYGQSRYRYVVYCTSYSGHTGDETAKDDIGKNAEGEKKAGQGEEKPGESSSQRQIAMEKLILALSLPLIIIAVALIVMPGRRR